MWVCVGLAIAGAIALTLYLIEKCKKYSLKGVLLKTVTSLFFVSIALYASYLKSGHIMNTLVIIGLLLGLSGDIWLDLKYVYPKDDKIYTYSGFIAFGVGHILFISGMFIEYFNNAHVLYAILPFVIAIVMAFGNLFLAKPLKLKFGELTPIVFIYSILLFSLPLSALSLCPLFQTRKKTPLCAF